MLPSAGIRIARLSAPWQRVAAAVAALDPQQLLRSADDISAVREVRCAQWGPGECRQLWWAPKSSVPLVSAACHLAGSLTHLPGCHLPAVCA